jgi:hypothetical protein
LKHPTQKTFRRLSANLLAISAEMMQIGIV